jgi:hypothetical protein
LNCAAATHWGAAAAADASTMPHLHIQVQNNADWQNPDLKTFPIYFRDVEHVRWGMRWSKQWGELMRNDRIAREK